MTEKMKTLVVYFSYDETVEKIATGLATAIRGDKLRLVTVERSGEKKVNYLWGTATVSMNPSPDLAEFDVNPEEYDLIFLGTPVWAMNYAPPFNTFFKMVHLKGKKIGLFMVHEGTPGIAMDELTKALSDNAILGRLSMQIQANGVGEAEPNEAATWGREVMNKARGLEL